MIVRKALYTHANVSAGDNVRFSLRTRRLVSGSSRPPPITSQSISPPFTLPSPPPGFIAEVEGASSITCSAPVLWDIPIKALSYAGGQG